MKRWSSWFKGFRLSRSAPGESEAQLRAMFSAMTDIILVINAEGRYVQVAPTNTALLYRSAGELLGKTFYDLFARQQADEFLGAVRQALALQRTVTLEYPMNIAGRMMWFEAKISPFSAEAVVWIAYDTTTLKQRERQLATVNTIGRTLAESLDLGQICEQLAAAMRQIFPDCLALLISLYDARRQTMQLIYGVDEQGQLDVAQFPLLPLEPPEHGPQSEAIHTRQAVVVNDYPERLRRTRRQFTVGEVPQSVLYAPMLAKGEVIGVVQVQSNTLDRFSPDDAGLLSFIANTAAVSIANARLFEAEREQHAVTEALHENLMALSSTLNFDEVLDLILRNIGRIVPNDAAGVLMIDQGVGRIVRWQGRITPGQEHEVYSLELPLDRTPNLRRIVQTGRALIIPDVQVDPNWIKSPATSWIHAHCAVPIRSQGRVVGVLEVHRAIPDFYTPDHGERLQALADQVGIAMQTAQLFDAEREERALSEALYDTTAALNSTLNFDEVLDRILNNVGQIVPNDAANIAVVEGDIVRSVRWQGYVDLDAPQKVQDIRWKLEDVPNLRQVIEARQPKRVADTHRDPQWIVAPAASWIRSYVATPIEHKGRVLGVLELSSSMPHFFTATHVARLNIFATQAAIAIENARLFDQVQRRAVEQAALFAAAHAVSSSLDFSVVLQRLAEQMARALDTTSVYIADWDPQGRKTTVLAEYLGAEAGPEERVSDLGRTYSIEDVLGEPYDWLMEGGTTVLHVDDETTSSVVREHLHQYGGTSVVLVALAARGTVFGYAALWESRRRREFTPAEISLCQSIAQQAAIAFENARLFEAERDQRALAEALYDTAVTLSRTLELDEVLQHILSNAGHIVPNDLASMIEIENNVGQITRIFGRLTPAQDTAFRSLRFSVSTTPNLRRLVEAQQPLAVPDVRDDPGWVETPGLDWIQSFVAAPIQIRGHVTSVLLLYSRTRGFYILLHAARLQIFAAAAAIAIENARLFEAGRKQLQLAQTLQAVGALLTAEMTLAEVFEQIFDLLARVVRYDSVSIHLVDDDGLHLAAGRGFRDAEQVRQDVASIIKHTVTERWGEPHQRLAVISDTRHDSRWLVIPASEPIHSWIGAALRVKRRLLGILNVDSKNVNEYDEAIGETVAAFANQAAIAIENAQLHEAERRYADKLEQRVQQRTAELERERKRTAAILQAAGEGIMMTDVEGRIEYMNPAMERLTGYALAEALGQKSNLWRSPRTPVALYESLWSTIKHGDIWRGELVNRRRDGRLYDAALTIAPLHDIDGRVTGYVGVQHDITQQKGLDRLKDEFVSNVSHELRTPIANVKLYLNLLTQGKPEKYEDYLQTLRREAARLEKLIEDLLDLSRLDLGTPQLLLLSTDLNQLAAQLIADRTALAAQRQLVVDYRSDGSGLYVQADEAKLVQVMSNLLTNAINYTPPGGQITVITAAREDEGKTWGTFTVQDTGPGISPQDLPHLFERFYRGEAGRKSRAPGTGLGLAISRQIMNRMGGRITVESEPGQGAAFTVWCKPI